MNTNTNLPQSSDLERDLLGSIMVFDEAMGLCKEADLQPGQFYLQNHEVLFEAMTVIDKREEPMEIGYIINYLRSVNKLPLAGGEEYIATLINGAISIQNVPGYIREIQNTAQKREIYKAMDQIRDLSDLDQDEYLDTVESLINNVTRNRQGSEFQSSKDVANRVLDEIKELRSKPNGVTGISTELKDLDRMTNGFHPGDLIILAARPAMGKSALALNFVNMVAKNNPGNVAMFSLEMPSEQLMKRLLSCESHVDGGKVNKGNTLTPKDIDNLHKAATKLGQRNIFIDDTSSLTPNAIFSKCKKLMSTHGDLSLVVIDYLQLITVANPALAANRQQAVSEISRGLKIMAKELNCPVIALSQLSRRIEERSDHEPQLSDLRESGSIEQDADIVMFVNRKDYYDREADQNPVQVVDLILAKHRNGETGTVNLVFEKNISRFSTIAKEGL